MKKIVMLTSVLALAACAGGNDNFGMNNVERIDTPTSIQSRNAAVTSIQAGTNNAMGMMAYTALHIENSGVVVPNTVLLTSDGRESSYRDTQEKNFQSTQYEKALTYWKNLYNIWSGKDKNPSKTNLKNAWLLAGGDAEEFESMYKKDGKDYIISKLDNFGVGKLIGQFFRFKGGEEPEWQPKFSNLDSVEFKTSYNGNNFYFNLDSNGVIKGVSGAVAASRDGDSNTFGGGMYTITSYGKELNLKYSDFGEIDGAGQPIVFAGGYDTIKRAPVFSESELKTINAGGIVSDVNFRGKAVGVVNKSQTVETDNAVLSVFGDSKGRFQLIMPFETNGTGSFNDVVVSGDVAAGTVDDISFSSGNINTGFTFTGGITDGHIGFYGDALATEATGMLSYSEQYDAIVDKDTGEVITPGGTRTFDAAFGLTRQAVGTGK